MGFVAVLYSVCHQWRSQVSHPLTILLYSRLFFSHKSIKVSSVKCLIKCKIRNAIRSWQFPQCAVSYGNVCLYVCIQISCTTNVTHHWDHQHPNCITNLACYRSGGVYGYIIWCTCRCVCNFLHRPSLCSVKLAPPVINKKYPRSSRLMFNQSTGREASKWPSLFLTTASH